MVNRGMEKMCERYLPGRGLSVHVEEKLDGSCCAVAKHNGEILALGRSGYPVESSPYYSMQMFGFWVNCYREEFDQSLNEGERWVGEWMASAVGTQYNLPHPPWVPFDLMRSHTRSPVYERNERIDDLSDRVRVLGPAMVSSSAMTVAEVREDLGSGNHGAIGMAEGAVWRVQRDRDNKVILVAKWVRSDKEDGIYLPSISGERDIWNRWIDERFPWEDWAI